MANTKNPWRSGGKRRNKKTPKGSSPFRSSCTKYPRCKLLPENIRQWFGYRLSFNTIANEELLRKKKKVWDGSLDTSTNSANMRSFMQQARQSGAYRNYTGLVVDFYEMDRPGSAHAPQSIFLIVQLDESCRSEGDVDKLTVPLKDGRWDNWNRLTPRDEDLMEMMTSQNDLLREFAVQFYKENNEAAGAVLELLTKMDPQARLDILSQFCWSCGKTKCNCK